MHGVVGHDPRLLGAVDHQDMHPNGQRRLAGLRDGNQISVGLLDDIFPAIGIGDDPLGRGAPDAADQSAPHRAQCGRARKLRPDDAASGAASGGAHRAVRADEDLARAHNHPTLHGRFLLGGVSGIGVGGVACVASAKNKRKKPRKQEKRQC